MMTKKNYEAIARCIHRNGVDAPECEYDEGKADAAFWIASEIATVMAVDNPGFDRAKFLEACGVRPASLTRRLNSHK